MISIYKQAYLEIQRANFKVFVRYYSLIIFSITLNWLNSTELFPLNWILTSFFFLKTKLQWHHLYFYSVQHYQPLLILISIFYLFITTQNVNLEQQVYSTDQKKYKLIQTFVSSREKAGWRLKVFLLIQLQELNGFVEDQI